jgi:hypothetical protein
VSLPTWQWLLESQQPPQVSVEQSSVQVLVLGSQASPFGQSDALLHCTHPAVALQTLPDCEQSTCG